MACPTYKRLCNRLIVSTAVTFENNTLVINVPAGSYADGEKYCIVVAQNIPAETTITSPVAISIGGDTTTLYPLNNPDCSQVTACAINRRTRYSTRVRTTPTSGVFTLTGKIPCSQCANNLLALPVPTTEAAASTSNG